MWFLLIMVTKFHCDVAATATGGIRSFWAMFEETEIIGETHRVERSSQDETDWAATVGQSNHTESGTRIVGRKENFLWSKTTCTNNVSETGLKT